MTEPPISIIVPIYNTSSPVLRRCIDSLLSQSFQSFELILVDDGSTNEAASICDSYAKHPQVHVFHTENHGLGPARNFGISKAHGEWIGFVDSDDWCETDYLKDFSIDTNNQMDLILQGLIRDKDGVELGRTTIRETQCEKKDISRFYYENNLIDFGSACCRLFRRSIFRDHHLQYTTTFSYGEDSAFFPKFVQHCNSIAGIAKEHYHYMLYDVATMSRKVHDTELLLAFIQDSTLSLQPIFQQGEYGLKIQEKHNRKSVALAMRAYANMYKLQYTRERMLNCIKNYLSEVRPLLQGSNLPWKEQIFYSISGRKPAFQLRILYTLFKLGFIKK